MQLIDIIGSLRRHWRVSVALLLLTGIAVGVFLFTRKQVRGADRWETSVLFLVPTRAKDGAIPTGVPPELLQGQAQLALSTDTIAAALKGAGLSEKDRGDVTFDFTSNFNSSTDPKKSAAGRGDILTLTVTAPEQAVAVRLAESYATAYQASRSKTVATDEEASTRSARSSLDLFNQRLGDIDSKLQAADPQLLARLQASDATDGTNQTAARGTNQTAAPVLVPVAADAPIETVLLAYEHRAVVTRILAARQAYADNSIGMLAPSAFATIVERPNPQQIVPKLPTPFVPVAVALGIGLLLAIGAPVLVDALDHTIREPRSAMRALAAPVLSTLPIASSSDLNRITTPGTTLDSAYRALATTSVATDQLPRAIVVTSPVGDAQDGVAANFAVALAALGLNVALVATNERQEWFVQATASEHAPTLTDMLSIAHAGRVNGQLRERLVPSSLANLTVLAPSAVESDDLLEGLPRLFEGLASAGVDVTVVAGPSLLEDPSATIFAWSTRSVLWVIEAGQVTDQEAREAASRLELAGASAFGVALVSAPE